MALYQIVILAIIQGFTEFLPISSSAHLALAPWLLGWKDPGLSFDIALHLGTLAAVLVWERNDIDFDRSFNQDFVALDAIGELSCSVGPWNNLLIEGDNFDAQRYLRMTPCGLGKMHLY